MRDAAIIRHQILHSALEDNWEDHMTIIRMVYGW